MELNEYCLYGLLNMNDNMLNVNHENGLTSTEFLLK